MSKILEVNYKKFDKFLRHVGCTFMRQKGSHRIYRRAGLQRPLVVPAKKSISITVIKSNLKTLGIPVEEYIEIMKKL
jgi:predicted RNA binding protein YcfA (HicA-like mRNA interferase family)